jgi:hypothetical protein
MDRTQNNKKIKPETDHFKDASLIISIRHLDNFSLSRAIEDMQRDREGM